MQMSPKDNMATEATTQAEFRKMASRSSVYLWEFILEVLEDTDLRLFCYWIDKTRREFCVKDPEEIAKLWGIMKHRPFMDKKKFLRAIRYYYTSQLITKIPGKKFTYKFGETPYAHPAFRQSRLSTTIHDYPRLSTMPKGFPMVIQNHEHSF